MVTSICRITGFCIRVRRNDITTLGDDLRHSRENPWRSWRLHRILENLLAAYVGTNTSKLSTWLTITSSLYYGSTR